MLFQPTKKQQEIRHRARQLYDDGYRLVGEWCRKIPDLTMNEWNQWERTEGFRSWWSDMFPEHAGVSLSDLRALEFEANRALMEALADGDLSAAQMVIRMVQAAAVTQEVASMSAEEWFAVEQKNGWLAEVK